MYLAHHDLESVIIIIILLLLLCLLWCALNLPSAQAQSPALSCILFLGVTLAVKGAALGFVQCCASSC